MRRDGAQTPGIVWGYGQEHSACVNALDGGGALVTSWNCTPGPNTWTYVSFDFSRWLRGIVRNNTTGASTHIMGKMLW